MTTTQDVFLPEEERAMKILEQRGGPMAAYIDTIDGIEVEDNYSHGQVGDVIKQVKQIEKAIEDERKALVGPLNATVKRINAMFKPMKDQCAETIALGKKKLKTYAIEQARIAEEKRKAAEEEQRKREEAAIAAAVKAEQQGNQEAAETIIDTTAAKAVKIDKTPQIAPSRGNTATVSTTRRWCAEVMDIKALCAAIAAGRMPEDTITVNKRSLNEMAQIVRKEMTEDGIRYYCDIDTAVR